MHKVHKQYLAEEDLIDIWVYTFKNWGEDKADSYLDELENAFNLISENPFVGVNSDEIIHVTRVLYDQMDFFKHLDL